MEINENEIVKFVGPIFHFCVKRLNNRHDAEDLAGEIMVHILNGVKKYQINSVESWVWRIARNRYARFIEMKNKRREIPSENDFNGSADICGDYDFIDEIIVEDEYRQVFKCLHTLSSEYRNILVDYYIGQLPVKQIAENYALAETTVKWRLNISREKIKTRINGTGENEMDRVYKPINWNTTACNGSMDSNRYLYSQIARAICEAAYEKPLTVEEISLKTGLPTMYIEDELPRLINGDAVVKDGGKYATNFIVLRLCDKRLMETKFAPLVSDIAGYFTELFKKRESDVAKMDFYGSDFTMERLGYIALPAVLRSKITKIKDGLDMPNGPYPPRLDGGYGWFIIDEKGSANESIDSTSSGCNITESSEGDDDRIYYFHIGKYFNKNIYHNDGTRWMAANKIVQKTKDGIIPEDVLTENDRIRLLKANLIIKDGDQYKLNFAVFDRAQYDGFKNCFDKPDATLDKMLAELISDIHKSFKAFVPKRLDSQINQWVSCYVHKIIGFVAEELINRGVLEKPDDEKPLTNGVFYISGKYVNV